MFSQQQHALPPVQLALGVVAAELWWRSIQCTLASCQASSMVKITTPG